VAWHLVGGLDLLEESERTGREPDDGHPVLLADWIRRDGLRCLKVKLRGNDAAWDYERLRRTGAWLHRPEHTAALSATDLVLIGKLKPLIAAGRFDPPWVRALASATDEAEESVRRVLRKQVSRGELYQVVKDLFYDAECVAELADIAGRLALTSALDAARYRDALGLGRKRTIQILEFFDRVGYTRRLGDVHVLRPDSGWSIARKAHAPGGAAGLQTQEGAPDASW